MTVEQRRLLVVLAHPDDETFICGGTLYRYAAMGVRITLVCATLGEMGSRVGVPARAGRESLGALRAHELLAAADALGIAEVRLLGLRDKTLDYYETDELAEPIARIMAEVDPQTILTFHERTGGHPDHCAIGRAARRAHAVTGSRASLYYVVGGWMEVEEQLQRAGMGPERLTAISVEPEAARAKIAAYRAHKTQSERMAWLWADTVEAIRRKTGPEFFLQGSGPARPGETELLPLTGTPRPQVISQRHMGVRVGGK
jgi:bacillithiol biosynthesis deacetylase BshB2